MIFTDHIRSDRVIIKELVRQDHPEICEDGPQGLIGDAKDHILKKDHNIADENSLVLLAVLHKCDPICDGFHPLLQARYRALCIIFVWRVIELILFLFTVGESTLPQLNDKKLGLLLILLLLGCSGLEKVGPNLALVVFLNEGKDKLLERENVHEGKSPLIVLHELKVSLQIFFFHVPLAARLCFLERTGDLLLPALMIFLLGR